MHYKLVEVPDSYPFPYMRSHGKPLAFEHRVVAEAALGRYLRFDEVVHHRDRNPLNNAPDNLQVLTIAEHKRLHRYDDLTAPTLFNSAEIAA